MANKGTLYMIPCPIVDHKNESIPLETVELTHSVSHFLVERARTARRWLSSLKHPTPIDDMTIFELDKNDPNQDLTPILTKLADGIDVGVVSESGCPGIADPGNRAVRYAHQHGFKVSPLVGPSSILMALMGSGFNGQCFSFHGYLPNKKPELSKKLKHLESIVNQSGCTQLFMEAPYRNGFMIEQIINVFSDKTFLCLACDINSDSEEISTKRISDWKRVDVKRYHKRPTIFVVGRNV